MWPLGGGGGGAGVGVRDVSVKQQTMNVIVMHYNPLGFRSLVKSLTCIVRTLQDCDITLQDCDIGSENYWKLL